MSAPALGEAAKPGPKLDFWFDFASTYSYLSALRIDKLAADAGVEIVWRPFLLGPIFKAQGWDTSPFNLYPAKGRYMIRDISRIAEARGHVFHMPSTFPAASLKAARLALACPDQSVRARFSKAVFEAEFGSGADIASADVLAAAARSAGLDFPLLSDRSASDEIKAALRLETETAQKLELFGAPTFLTRRGEIFWGDDRLESAILWARAELSNYSP